MQGRHLFILLVFALFASPLAAQETTGKIEGRVTDAQGLAVPGATVTATGPQGSKTRDDRRRWPLQHSVPDARRVHRCAAELQGFKAVEQKDVTVRRRSDVLTWRSSSKSAASRRPCR